MDIYYKLTSSSLLHGRPLVLTPWWICTCPSLRWCSEAFTSSSSLKRSSECFSNRNRVWVPSKTDVKFPFYIVCLLYKHGGLFRKYYCLNLRCQSRRQLKTKRAKKLVIKPKCMCPKIFFNIRRQHTWKSWINQMCWWTEAEEKRDVDLVQHLWNGLNNSFWTGIYRGLQ